VDRRTFLKLLLAGGGTVTAPAAWASLIEPRMHVVRERAVSPAGWPADVPAMRVAVIADPHVGTAHMTLDRLSEIVADTNALRPDLVLLAGDYIASMLRWYDLVPPELIAERLAALRAPLGVVAVLGNHDWWFDGPRVTDAIRRTGIPVLENDTLPLTWHGRRVWIACIADDTTRRPDVRSTMRRIPTGEPALALMHDPATFAAMPLGPYVSIAGHTHGGQVWLPGVGALVTPGRAPRRWAYGHIEENGKHLVVSAGLNTSIVPVRLNMPPEILLLTIAAPDGIA
jgi:predicted MPP superfamily phosphohydrolase